jgi:probable rRNA maturation factor
MLGDIVISVETAERQARARAQGLEAELFHLGVHGLCHLLGYDHATRAEERVMFAYEARLRAEAGAA